MRVGVDRFPQANNTKQRQQIEQRPQEKIRAINERALHPESESEKINTAAKCGHDGAGVDRSGVSASSPPGGWVKEVRTASRSARAEYGFRRSEVPSIRRSAPTKSGLYPVLKITRRSDRSICSRLTNSI